MNAYIALLDYAISKDSANTDGVAPYIELLFDGVPVQDRKKQGNMLTQMKKAIGEFLDEAAKDTAEALR